MIGTYGLDGAADPYGALDELAGSLDRIEELFLDGSYAERGRGYIVSAGGALPESPKLLIYEDERGLHLEGRGDGLSEEMWLDLTFRPGEYLTDGEGFYVGREALGGGALDGRTLAIRLVGERLTFCLSDGMDLPPVHLWCDPSY
jgi:hypothetical protein